MKKRIVSLLLTAAMLVGFLPTGLVTPAYAAGDEKAPIDQSTFEALGFGIKDQFDDDSYVGPGNTTMNTKNELYLDYQAHKNYGWMLRDNLNLNHPEWTSYESIGAYKLYGQYRQGDYDHLNEGNGYSNGQTGGQDTVIGSGITSTGSHKSRAYKTAVEFRSSSGKKDLVAQLYVTSGTNRTDWVAKLEILKYNTQADGTYTTSVTSSTTLGAAPALDESGMIFQQYFDALYDIAAGDFDGDGIDEIAVYFGTNTVKIYDTGSTGTRLSLKQTIGTSANHGKSEILKEGLNSSYASDSEHPYGNGENTHKFVERAAVITLTAGDLKKDFSDDLVITVSNPQQTSDTEHENNPYTYIYGYNGSKMVQDYEIPLRVDDWTGDTAANDAQVFKSANSAIGDIDGDGCVELVIGGRLCRVADGGPSDTEWGWGALIPVEYDYGSKSYSVGSATQMELKEYDEDKILIHDGIDSQIIRYRAPVGMAIADLDGVGSDKPYTFFFSELFTYDGETRNFSQTSMYLDTIKNQKNNVDESEDKGQHWVSDVVVGNFNGNDDGAEQIIAIVACKESGNTDTEDDWYWYYMSYIAKETKSVDGKIKIKGDGAICRQCEGIINQGRSYINRSDKSRASVFVSIAAPDVDNDGILLEYIDAEMLYTKPEVQAVLQSAPYFADVAATYGNYLNNGATAYGTAEGSSEGVTASVEASLGAYVDVEFSTGAAADLEAELALTTSYDHMTSSEVETSVEYSGAAGDDYVVMYTIPYTRYFYNATYPDGTKGIMKLEEPFTPATVIVPVETYDAIAATTEGLEQIRGNILTSTPGQPKTYTTTPKGSWTAIGSVQALTNAGANSGSLVTVSQTLTDSKEHSFTIGLEESFKIGFGTGAVGNKVTAGITQGLAINAGGAYSNMEGVAYTGSVDNLPAGVEGYAFNWQLGISETKLNGEDIIVVGYQTSNVKQAPSLPRDISIASVTSDSATLEWGVASDAAMYEVYVSSDQNEWLPLEAVPVTYAVDGKIYYNVKGLSSGKVYYFRVNACDGYGVRSLETNPVSVQTLSADASISVITQPEDTSAALDHDATFKVVAQGNGVGTMYYQWYKRSLNSDGKSYGSWSAISISDAGFSGATSPTLTVKAVQMDDNGVQYRCRVSQSANYLYTNEAMLTVSKSPTETSLALAVGDKTIESGGTVNAASTTVTNITQDITTWEEVVSGDYAKMAAGETETETVNGDVIAYSYTYTAPYVWTKDGKYYADNNGAVGAEYPVSYVFMNGEDEIITDDDAATFAALTLPTSYGSGSDQVASSVSSTKGFKINGTDQYVYVVETEQSGEDDKGGSTTSVTTTYYTATGEHKYSVEQQKKDANGNLLYIDGENNETTTVTDTPAMETVEKVLTVYSQVTLNSEASYITVDGTDYLIDSFVPYKEEKTETVVVGQKTENHAGDTLTLTAIIKPSDITGKVSFYLENTATGVTITVPATQKEGVWTADYTFGTTGIYKITAYYGGDSTYFSSRSAEKLIYVSSVAKELNLEGGSMTYGQSFNLNPMLFSSDGKAPVSGVEYSVKKDGSPVTGLINGNTFTPKAAGTYVISASYSEGGSTYTTSSTIVVSPRSVTITAPDVELNVALTETERKSAIDGKKGEVVIANVRDEDKSALESIISLYSIAADPFDGYVTNAAGNYSIDVVLGASAELSSKYSFVLQAGTLTMSQGKETVTATPGANGSVRISYTTTISDSNGTYTSAPLTVESGTLLPVGATVTITAIPNSGFGVDKWVVDGEIVSGTGTEYTFTLSKETEVDVYFAYTYNTLNFSTPGNGTVTGAYQGSEAVFNSGDSINATQTVVLTAQPAQGYVVSYWTKDGVVVKAEDGASSYTGNTITVAGANSTTTYVVYFEAEEKATVTVKFVHKLADNQLEDVLGCGVTFNDTAVESTSNTFVFETTKHDNVTITVDIPGNMLVDYWEKGGKVVANAVEEISMYDISSDVECIVYCETPNERTLTFGTELINTNGGELDEAGTLTVTRSGAKLASGATLPQGAVVNFAAATEDGYRIAKWTVNGVTVEAVSDLTITDNTTVKVFFEKKPVVEIKETTDNGIANGFVSGSAMGAYVEFGDDVQIDIAPDKGYIVGTVKVGAEDVTAKLVTPSGENTDKRYFVIDDVNTNTTVTISYVPKPVITLAESEDKGSVTITATKDFVDAAIDSGSYVDFGSGLSALVEPDFGYVVSGVTVNGQAAVLTDVANSDNKTFTAENVQADTAIVVTYAALNTTSVTFGVIDKNDEDDGGQDGTITASVDRKGMKAYKVSDASELDEVYEGSAVTFTATPDAGYKVSKWFVNGEEVSEQPALTITAGMADQEIMVQFDMVGQSIDFAVTSENENEEAQITATFTPDGGATAEGFASGNRPAVNGVVELTVSGIDDGYEIEGWYVNGVKAEGETASTFRYNAAVDVGAEITVKVIRSSYEVTFSVVNGTVTAAVGETAVASGDSIVGDIEVTFTAQPKEETGYTFVGWTVNGEKVEDTAETLTLVITEDVEVEAVYELDQVRYTVTYGVIDTNGEEEGGLNGTLKANGLSSSPVEVTAGRDITFTAKPAQGYRVAGWYSDAEGTALIDGTAVEQLVYESENLVAPLTVYVKFETIPQYIIDLTIQGLGRIAATVNGEEVDAASGSITVQRYDDVVLTATPDEYQYLVGWTVGTESKGNSLTLTLTDIVENTSVTAEFAASQNVELKTLIDTTHGSIKVQAGFDEANAVINPTTGIVIHKGQDVLLEITPAEGKMVKAWSINGEEMVNYLDHQYTIENIDEDTVVEVVFEDLKTYAVPGDGDGYTVEDTVETPVDCGDPDQIRDRGNVEFKVVPEYPNVITELTVNGGEGSTGSAVLNSDGSWTVKVENVKDDITFDIIEIISGKQMIVNCGEGGSVTVTLNGETISNGRALAVGDVITIKAAADSGYTLGELTVNGETFKSGKTYTVLETDESIVINAAFAQRPAGGGGGGGGGGGAIPAAGEIVIEQPVNGQIVTEPGEQADAGQIVVVITKPNAGYITGSITVTDEDGDKLSVTEREDGTYEFKMPDGEVRIKVNFIVDFTDVSEDDYYADAVAWAYEQGITAGISATSFGPALPCTRAQMATFLWRAAGSPEPVGSSNLFADVSADAYYAKAVQWALEQGITAGTSATTFSPDAPCTRAQMATFLYRNEQANGGGFTGAWMFRLPFTDVPEWAFEPIAWCYKEGITAGTSATTFSPDAPCTRAQMVTFLYRYFGK